MHSCFHASSPASASSTLAIECLGDKFFPSSCMLLGSTPFLARNTFMFSPSCYQIWANAIYFSQPLIPSISTLSKVSSFFKPNLKLQSSFMYSSDCWSFCWPQRISPTPSWSILFYSSSLKSNTKSTTAPGRPTKKFTSDWIESQKCSTCEGRTIWRIG